MKIDFFLIKPKSFPTIISDFENFVKGSTFNLGKEKTFDLN